jgi:hypothetical protein
MMNDQPEGRQAQEPREPHEAGLCGTCAHMQAVVSSRGARFYRCGLSFSDPAFPRYPPIPVVSCAGFVRVPVESG